MKKLNLLSLFLALTVMECKAYDESLLYPGSAGPPPRPPASTSSDSDNFGFPDDTNEVTFAIRDIYLSADGDLAQRIGVDVDDRNTVNAANTECRTPTGVDVPTDGPQGIDNAIGGPLVLGLVGLASPCLEDDIALTQGLGKGTILLRVQKWNGLPDDANVEVTIAQSVVGTREDPTNVSSQDFTVISGPNAGEPAPPPAWRGADSWYVDPEDFTDGNLSMPENVDGTAYVAKGRLVVTLRPTDLIELFTGELDGENQGLPIRLGDGLLLGDIEFVDDPDTEEVEAVPQIVRGVFTGRYGVTQLLDATPKMGICGEEAVQGQTQAFNNNADVLLNEDNGDANAVCDALSLGIAFTAVGGKIEDAAPGTLQVSWECPSVDPPASNKCCLSTEGTPAFDLNGCNTGELAAKVQTYRDFVAGSANQIPVPVPDF